MKKKLAIIALALALFTGFAADEKARANTAVSFNLFYSSLAPYGNWVSMDYGYAWAPTGVGAGWRPYMDGRWVWSDLGWTWASYEPWGWATYHYGRWVMDPYYGWLWIPGTTWAPAWVSWYQTPGYVGWSPLPPDNNFFLEIGLGFGGGGYYGGGYYGGGYGYYPGYYGVGNYFSFSYYDYDYYGYGYKHGKHGKHGKYRHHDKGHYYDNDYYAPGDHCVFVPEDKFGHKNSKLVAVDIDKNRDLVTNRNTRNVTNIQVDNGKVHNLGPNRSVLESSGGARIERVSLVDSDLTTVRDRNARGASTVENGKFAVYRPNIEHRDGENPFSASAVHNPGQRDRNINNGSGTDRASLDGRANPGQGLRPGSGDRNGPTSGVRNPVDGNAIYGNTSPNDHGVIRRNGSGNDRGEDQRLGSMRNGSDRSGMTPSGLAPNSGPMRPERGNLDSGGPAGPAMSRPQNSGPGMNRQSLDRSPNYGPRQEALSNPNVNRPSGRSVNSPRNYEPSKNDLRGNAPTMNRPSVERSQPVRQGNGSRNMIRPQNYSPDAGSPSVNRQQSYTPSMKTPSQIRQGSAPSVNRQNRPSVMRGPERQSAPSQVRSINSSPQQRQSYDRGGMSNQGRQNIQPRSYRQPSSGNVRSGGSSGSRQSYNRGSSRSSSGSMRSAPSSSYRGSSGGGSSFNRSSIRGR